MTLKKKKSYQLDECFNLFSNCIFRLELYFESILGTRLIIIVLFPHFLFSEQEHHLQDKGLRILIECWNHSNHSINY